MLAAASAACGAAKIGGDSISAMLLEEVALLLRKRGLEEFKGFIKNTEQFGNGHFYAADSFFNCNAGRAVTNQFVSGRFYAQ